MTRSDAAALAIALVAAACRAPAPAAPAPSAVHPAVGFAAGRAEVRISGESFEVEAAQQVDEARSAVDAGYRAWLGPVELADVTWIDTRTLRARVPAGMALGRHALAVEGPFGRGVLASAYEVIDGTPAALAATLALPTTAGVGEDVDVVVEVSNPGEALVAAVRPEIAASGAGPVACVAIPAPQDVPAGGARTFVSRCHATAAGEAIVTATVRGTDPRTGDAVSADASGSLLAEGRAEMSVTVLVPPGPIALGPFPASVTVANVGAVPADVAVSTPALTDASTAAAVMVTAPTADAMLQPGEARTFGWTYRAIASGRLQLQASVSWTDAGGGPRTAAALSSVTVVQEHTQVLAVDPLGDGSPFAFVAPHLGQLWVGPSRTGDALARMQLDGSGSQRVALAFSKDVVTGSTASNKAAPPVPPYPSIGFTGCQADTAACGPDNEDGRGLLTSVAFDGDEWLLLAGARSAGELDYVYLSRASAAPGAFSYVDIGDLLGGATRGISAAHGAGGRLYLGFPDNGGSRPYGVALLKAPPAAGPGLDAVKGVDALDLELHAAYDGTYHAFTPITMVDAIAELHGHVYFFNGIGCLVSKTATPAAGGDFLACSPAEGLDYAQAESIVPVRQFDLEPTDRAWPQVAVWNGRLLAIRNTLGGPQLWSCDPARRGDPALCDPSDWELVAADAGFRTRLGRASASAATLLVATPTHLFVGFDDPAGVQVFRTRVADPAVASDFTGKDGCLAGTTGCEGLGSDGLGATLTRIFDAKAVATPEGRTDLFLTAGDGVGPAHVVRLAP
jgi:hypothetical protein